MDNDFITSYIFGLLIRFPVLVLYIIATLLEFRSANKIFALVEHRSICITAHEVSSAVAVYVMFTACPIVPNICYIIGIFLLPRLCRDPVSIVYNIVMGTLCIVGFAILDSSLTMCGNEDQRTMNSSGKQGLIAGILHMINAIYTHCALPWDESYLQRRRQK